MAHLYLLCALLASLMVTVTPTPRRQKSSSTILSKDLKVAADNRASFVDLASRLNYTAQEFKVTTDDGYVLAVQRMKNTRCGTFKTRPIFLMCGLLQSSEAWLDAGPGASYPHLLADDCYDVWLGNYRGNANGRAHVTLNPDKDAAFWDYNIEHISYYDVPAMVDFVLNHTDAQDLTYIGFSQGGGSFMTACTLRPGYSSKVNLFIGLAPTSRIAPSRTAFFRSLILVGSFVHRYFPHEGNWQEVFQSGSAVSSVTRELCEFSTVSMDVLTFCEGYLAFLESTHRGSLSMRTHARLHAHFPAGSSAKLLDHYAQLMNVTTFRRYDHGPKKNVLLYGQTDAPDVDLSKVSVPTVIFYGMNDGLVPPSTVEWLLTQLPNVVGVEKNSDMSWNHFDMIYSKNLKTSVYDSMRKYLENIDC